MRGGLATSMKLASRTTACSSQSPIPPLPLTKWPCGGAGQPFRDHFVNGSGGIENEVHQINPGTSYIYGNMFCYYYVSIWHLYGYSTITVILVLGLGLGFGLDILFYIS